jgi:glucose-6-phosphate dehydrogenase assembly protein OpcA
VCSEVISIWLRGPRAHAPASVVQPLLVPDLPAFLRWRGSLPYGATELEQLLDVADRLVVNGREWDDAARDYASLAGLFDRIVVSDIAWARTRPWRAAIAALWPAVASVEELRVRGPEADALLLDGWLRSRLDRDVRLVHEPADELEAVEVDGAPVVPERPGRPTPSDLLSDQLEIYVRDPVYEEAVEAAASVAA